MEKKKVDKYGCSLNHNVRNGVLSILGNLTIIRKKLYDSDRDALIAIENIREQCKRIIVALENEVENVSNS